MFPLLINPLPILLTLSAAFGVLVHDTQIDAAARTVLTTPIAIVGNMESELLTKMNDPHINNERASVSRGVDDLRPTQPRTPSRSDDKKYVVQKKSSVLSYGSEYIWPSI
jgi:hypothetical protein